MYDEQSPYGSEREEAEARKDRFDAFISGLEAEAKKRAAARNLVEKRWIEDLRNYHGIYGSTVTNELKRRQRSQVFINLTRTKTDALQARLWDLLFPTDDKNWAIEPTPVPELDETSEETQAIVDDAADTVEDFEDQAKEADGQGDPAAAQGAKEQAERVKATQTIAQKAADKLHETKEEAIRRCGLMELEIDDQLVHSNYQAAARDAIEDACKLGIGILKGPILGESTRQRWEFVEGVDEVTGETYAGYDLVTEQDPMPGIERVDPWGFYPSIDAKTPEESEGFFERHLLNRKQMRALARRGDIDEQEIRQILQQGSTGDQYPSYLPELLDLTEQQTTKGANDLYHVWEYTGPVAAEDLEALAVDMGDEDLLMSLPDEIDPLDEINMRIWFCQGRLLSVAMYPLDSQEPIYSVFTLSRDEYSMFGFGMPSIIADPQSMLNAATRMLMDNSGVSSGPQIVIDKEKIRPVDDSYTIHPYKVWEKRNREGDNSKPFETFDIPSHQAELGGIIEMSRVMIDEMSGMPAIAQGEQGAAVTKTAQGMALLMNSANVAFRRYVKNFDDDVTQPIIRRMYHFNMQFSKKDGIKGDYEVKTRGSSVLLVREMQANNLMLFAQAFGEHSKFGPRIKDDELLDAIVRSMMLSGPQLLYSDREYRKKQEEAAKLKSKMDPAVQAAQAQNEIEKAKLELGREKIQADMTMKDKEWAARERIQASELQEANMRLQAQLAAAGDRSDLQAAAGVKKAQISAQAKQAEIDAKDRGLAVETQMALQTGNSAGGAV